MLPTSVVAAPLGKIFMRRGMGLLAPKAAVQYVAPRKASRREGLCGGRCFTVGGVWQWEGIRGGRGFRKWRCFTVGGASQWEGRHSGWGFAVGASQWEGLRGGRGVTMGGARRL